MKKKQLPYCFVNIFESSILKTKKIWVNHVVLTLNMLYLFTLYVFYLHHAVFVNSSCCFRFCWDFTMLCLLITNMIVLPVAIAFFNEESSITWAIFNCLNDGLFITDIILNFRTGIAHQHMAVQVILDPQKIKVNYLKGQSSIKVLKFIKSILLRTLPKKRVFFLTKTETKLFPDSISSWLSDTKLYISWFRKNGIVFSESTNQLI